MALQFGKDGAERALRNSLGQTSAAIATLYVGMLDSLDYTGLTPTDLELGELTLTQVTTNEMSVTDFYTPVDRTAITFDWAGITVDDTGTYVLNADAPAWDNDSGANQTVPGFFISDTGDYTQDGSGEILWLGAPSVGSQNFTDGETITLSIGNLSLRVV